VAERQKEKQEKWMNCVEKDLKHLAYKENQSSEKTSGRQKMTLCNIAQGRKQWGRGKLVSLASMTETKKT